MTTTPHPISLYALDREASVIQAQIDAAAQDLASDDPDVQALAVARIEELLTAGEQTRGAIEEKCDSCLWVADKLTGRAAQLREHAERLLRLADEDSDRAQKLIERVVGVLQGLDPEAKSFRLLSHKLQGRTSTYTDISDVDVDTLPPELVRIVPPVPEQRKPDTVAIKARLKAGGTVPGAKLVTKRSWTVS